MPKKFDPKVCVICGCTFTPTSASQILCENIDCKRSYRKTRDKVRYKKDRGVVIKVCSSCGREFEAKNTRRTVCYSEECELGLKHYCLAKFRERERALNPKVDKSAITKEYFSSFGYLADMSTYVNGKSKIRVICPSEHEYYTSYSNFKSGCRCSKCSGNAKKTIEEVREVCSKNGFILLSSEYLNYKSPLRCECSFGHVVNISYSNIVSGNGCDVCRLLDKKPDFNTVKHEFEVRGFSLLQDYCDTVRDQIQCICPNGHKTTMCFDKLKHGSMCKVCYNESQKLKLEEVKKTFLEEGYVVEQDYYINSDEPIRCVCPKGHHTSIRYNLFKSLGNRCGICFKENQKLDIQYVREYLSTYGYILNQDYFDGVDKLTDCVCPNGHEISIRFSGFKRGKRCGKCHPSRSKPEIEVCSFVESLGVEVAPNDRVMIKPKELDVYVPSKNVAIEYCGFYWHCEKTGEKPKSYHYDKMISCAEAGIRLITIFEDEWVNRRDVVESRIKNALNMSERRIFARKCKVGELSFAAANDFLSKYHLQGKSNSNKRWGLFYEGELVQVITVGNLSRAHTGKGGKFLELKRFANLPNVSVVGGASKLFKVVKEYAIENGYTHIKSYCDMRYANYAKPVYESLGFELSHFTRYTPHYVRGEERFRNQGLCKTEEERLTGKTEWELREEQGYDRIWDCGHRTYVLKL
jgi:hypothetical protein